jgi:fibronectin type 3 domain-containing protein
MAVYSISNRVKNRSRLRLKLALVFMLVAGIAGSTLILNQSNAAGLPTGNLLRNPGFEQWGSGLPSNWVRYSTTTKVTQTSPARSGSYTAKVASTASRATGAGLNDGSTPTVTNTTIGATYTASCWVKASRSMTVNVLLRELKQSGSAVGSASTPLAITSTTTWHQIRASYTAKASGNKLPLSIYSNNTYNGGPTFLVDDCSLTVADTTAPSKPSGLTTGNVTTTGVRLSWSASSDNVGVTGYKVIRNGSIIATTTATSFNDSSLTPGTQYSYTVAAVDAAGNTSAASSAVSVTTLFAPPNAPANLTAVAVNYAQVDLNWSAATPGSGTITGYQIHRNGTLLATVNAPATSYSDTTVSPDTTYSYSVTTIDSNQLTSPAVSTSATTPALVPPSAPDNVQATTPSTTQVNLSWTASVAGTGSLTGYQIQRNGTLVATVTTDTTSYSDSGLNPGTTYSYVIIVIDSLDQTGASTAISKTTPFTLEDWNTALANVIHSDVTQSVTLPDGRILWTFGDTTKVNGVSTVSGYGYPHSAFVTQEPGTLNFTAVRANYGYGWQPVPNWSDGTFFWMGTPVIDNGTLYVLGTRIKMTSNGGFSVVGRYMASFDAQTLAYQSMIELPGGASGNINWNGITKTPDGWWVTGTHMVPCYWIRCFAGDSAIVPFGSLADTSSWQVVDDIIPPSTNIGDSLEPAYSGPNEWSVYTKEGGAYGGVTIAKFTAPSLTGTWSKVGSWPAPSPQGTITYGPAIHREQPTPDGQVLLSYNVNNGTDDDYRAIFTYLP